MKDWGEASLADWLRATLTLRERRSEGEDALLEHKWGVESCARCGRTGMRMDPEPLWQLAPTS